MKRLQLIGALGALLSTFITASAHAALVGVLPATVGGTNYQAYYDTQLNITWAANANINGSTTWANQMAWAAGLNIDGVTGWRLPNMDVNGDGTIVSSCSGACMDNEYLHLYTDGIRPGSGPFSNVQSSDFYWSSTTVSTPSTPSAAIFWFQHGIQGSAEKIANHFAWAVHSGNVSAVPVPAAVWLFGSGLMGLMGLARRQR